MLRLLSDAAFAIGGYVCSCMLRLLSEATFAIGGYVQRAAPNSMPPVYCRGVVLGSQTNCGRTTLGR